MLYVGKSKTMTRVELHKVGMPIRGSGVGENWIGIGHGFLADKLVERIMRMGHTVIHEVWQVNRIATDLYGCVDIIPALDAQMFMPREEIDTDIMFSVGIRHSNIGKFGVHIALGARVIVCQNGLLVGDSLVKRRHCTGIHLDSMIDEALIAYQQHSTDIVKFVKALRAVPVTHYEACALIFEICRCEAMPYSLNRTAFEEWINPSYADFFAPNLWTVYNACTNALKETAIPTQYQSLQKLYHVFTDILRRNSCETLLIPISSRPSYSYPAVMPC